MLAQPQILLFPTHAGKRQAASVDSAQVHRNLLPLKLVMDFCGIMTMLTPFTLARPNPPKRRVTPTTNHQRYEHHEQFF